ncbi:MAG TPA: EthD family reductase [Burkholderiales bacterium]|nr:EthD family reductase [Burkholderiales bacterium]
MSFCLFLEFAAGEVPRFGALPGLQAALAHTPARAHDPFLDDGAPPQLVLQLYFASLPELEQAATRVTWPQSLVSYEAMLVRRYPVRDSGAGEPWCTYLVRYEGPAQDPHAWLAHYLAHHPALMARLPGIRELEIYTALDWVGAMPGERLRSLQRNKVAFENPGALNAALDSPERRAMRADYAALPPFSGRVLHFPMLTRRIPGIPGLS